MKKHLLALSLMVLSMGMFSQSTIWQPYNADVDSFNTQGCRYMWAVDTNSVWALFYDGTYTTRANNEFTRTDDGMTFKAGLFLPDTFYYNPSNIVAVNDSVAMISCYSKDASRNGVIMRTNDSGKTWMNIADTSFMYTGGANFPNVVHFYDNNIGWTMGDPNNPSTEYEIYRTWDGGATWTRVPAANVPNPTSGEYGLTNVYTTYGWNNIWWGTNKGRVFRSNDTGATWAVANPGGMAAGIQGLAFRDAMNGFVWGINTAGGPTVWKRTSDGGITWTTVTMNATDVGRYDMCAIPGRAAYMSVGINVGGSAYVTSITTDDGATWNVLETGITNTERMLKVMMLDSMHGWAGTFTDQTTPYLYGMNKFIGPNTPLTCPMTVSGATVACSGNAVTLTAGGVSAYSWSANAGSATTNTVTINATTSDVYTVTGTAGSCTNTATFSLTVNPTPTVVVTPASDSICVLNSTTIGASGATTYNWSGSGLTSTSGANVSTITYTVAGTYTYNCIGTSTGCNSVTTTTITVLPCVGINEVSGGIASVYPNPSKGNITVYFGKALAGSKVVVTDMIGKQVYSSSVYSGTEKLNIDLSSMPKGLYLISVSNNTGSTVKKMIIE